MTPQQEIARDAYIELWAEFYVARDEERESLAGSLDFLQPLCASTPEEFKEWADRSVFMYKVFWEKYREQMLNRVDEMLAEGRELDALRLKYLIEGAEPGA